MKKFRNLLHRIIYDNKLLFIVSLILGFVFWLIVTISLSPTDVAVIKDVPVSIDLVNSVPAKFDLQIFGQTDFAVDITISGKRSIVNSSSINKNSVKVVAQTSYVDSAGKHTLKLKITKADENDEFEILSSSEEEIECYFDVYKEQDFPIEARLVYDGDLVEGGYYSTQPLVSAENVLVSGPATEVNAISHLYARAEVEKELNDTQTYQAELVAVNDIGAQLHYLTFDNGNADVTVTVPVYLLAEKPLTVSFKGKPADYPEDSVTFAVEPDSARVGIADKDGAAQLEAVEVASIDFSQLKPGKNEFTFKADEITGVVFPDGPETVKVTVDVKGCEMAEMTLPVENISFANAPDKAAATVTAPVEGVKAVGPKDALKELEDANLYGMVDLKGFDHEAGAAQEMPVKISVKGSGECWVYGTYTVTVN